MMLFRSLAARLPSRWHLVGMSIPQSPTGLPNFYEAHVSAAVANALTVISLPIDSLGITERVVLVKIDAEGHERFVLAGMRKLLEEHRPILIVERGSEEVLDAVLPLRYASKRLQGSPNVAHTPGS